MSPKKYIFKNQSTSRIVSPENFDELAEIIDSKSWLTMMTLASLIYLILIWSIFGKIPVNITGKGILIYPRQVNKLESPIRGQIEQIKVNDGDCVEKDEVIAMIEPSDIKQQLKQKQNQLIQLQSQDDQADSLQQQQTHLQNQTIAQQKASKQQQLETYQALIPLLKDQGIDTITQQKNTIQERLKNLQHITPELKQKGLENLKKQRLSLQQQYQSAQQILPTLKNRWEKRHLLLMEGALSEDQVLQSEQDYRQILQTIPQLQAQLQELEVKQTQIQQQYLDHLGTISEYQAQLKEIELKETEAQQKYQENLINITQINAELKDLDRQQQQLSQTTFQDQSLRDNQIQETQHNIARLQKQYDDNREIKSPVAGCILELTLSQGEVIETGRRIGSISLNQNSIEMIGVTYFSIGEGKKIEPRMKAQITPDTVKRQRFGGIVGTVTEVSPFPITKEAASKIVGNPEIVEELGKQGALIEVKIKLEPNQANFSGYQWSSSSGPQLLITQGTTTMVRVSVEKRRPITFVLPFLRKWTGIY